MQTEAQTKIYADQKTAKMIAGKLTKRQGVEHMTVPVTGGFQVCHVTKLPSAMPKPYVAPSMAAAVAAAPKTPKAPTEKAPALSWVLLGFKRETPVYLDVFHEGKLTSIGKTVAVKWEVVETQIKVLVPAAYAKKKGFPVIDPEAPAEQEPAADQDAPVIEALVAKTQEAVAEAVLDDAIDGAIADQAAPADADEEPAH